MEASGSEYNSKKNMFAVISCVKTLTSIIKTTVTVTSAKPTEISNLSHMLLLSSIYSDIISCAAHYKMFQVDFLKYFLLHNKNNHTFHIF